MEEHEHEWHFHGGDQVGPDTYTRKFGLCVCGAVIQVNMAGQLVRYDGKGETSVINNDELKGKLKV